MTLVTVREGADMGYVVITGRVTDSGLDRR
jgi:hypothetical protein